MDSSKRKNSLIKRLKEIKINAKLGPKSLQGQLILSVWLGLAVVLIPINTINTIRTRETATQLTRKTLEEQASFVYFGVVKWRQSISELLNLLAFAPQIRQLDATNTSQIFDRLDVLFPNRSWRLWNREGELLVANKIMEPASRDAALSKKILPGIYPREKKSRDIQKMPFTQTMLHRKCSSLCTRSQLICNKLTNPCRSTKHSNQFRRHRERQWLGKHLWRNK